MYKTASTIHCSGVCLFLLRVFNKIIRLLLPLLFLYIRHLCLVSFCCHAITYQYVMSLYVLQNLPVMKRLDGHMFAGFVGTIEKKKSNWMAVHIQAGISPAICVRNSPGEGRHRYIQNQSPINIQKNIFPLAQGLRSGLNKLCCFLKVADD